MTEDIFDMGNERIFNKEIEKLRDIFLLCNVCGHSKISVVMLLGHRIAGISRKLETERKKYALRQNTVNI